MKGLGIALVGILAVAGGIAAATIITKKKLEKENDEDYYDDWDEEWDDDGADFDFDEDEDITDIEEEPDDAPVEDCTTRHFPSEHKNKKTAPAEETRKVVEEEEAPETSEKL